MTKYFVALYFGTLSPKRLVSTSIARVILPYAACGLLWRRGGSWNSPREDTRCARGWALFQGEGGAVDLSAPSMLILYTSCRNSRLKMGCDWDFQFCDTARHRVCLIQMVFGLQRRCGVGQSPRLIPDSYSTAILCGLWNC